MKHYKLKIGKGELNSTSGNHLCGLFLAGHVRQAIPVNFQPRRADAIADRDILLSQIGHLGLRPLMATLIRKLRGHYNYYGVTHNSESLWAYWAHVNREVYKWLNRRSQRRSFAWARFNAMFKRYKIPTPIIKEAPSRRRYVKEFARVNAEVVNV